MNSNHSDVSGLYVHIPFCGSKCYYCDFFSAPGRQHDMDAYVDAAIRELDARAGNYPLPFRTVYVGGGTPSALPLPALKRLLERLNVYHHEEFTVEVNPEDVTPALAGMLVESGVNRVSMGIQSLDDKELAAVGRRHNARRAIEAVDTLRRAGVANLSLDLIYGLPGQTTASWEQSLRKIIALRPEHISVYALSYEPGTRLWAMRETGKVREVPEEVSAEMYQILCRATAEAGYRHYEIANFALPGRESRHNSSYWTFTPYLGVGAGAHSFDGTVRSSNPCNLKKYLADPAGASVVEKETDTDMLNEFIMVGLRTAVGVDAEALRSRFGSQALRRIVSMARRLAEKELVELTPGGFRIPERLWLVSDPIIVEFFE